jgi:hypothetical protein
VDRRLATEDVGNQLRPLKIVGLHTDLIKPLGAGSSDPAVHGFRTCQFFALTRIFAGTGGQQPIGNRSYPTAASVRLARSRRRRYGATADGSADHTG